MGHLEIALDLTLLRHTVQLMAQDDQLGDTSEDSMPLTWGSLFQKVSGESTGILIVT